MYIKIHKNFESFLFFKGLLPIVYINNNIALNIIKKSDVPFLTKLLYKDSNNKLLNDLFNFYYNILYINNLYIFLIYFLPL